MHNMTKDNLEAAFAGESQAHMKYLIFANKALKEGLPNVARLFRATSYAEQVHAVELLLDGRHHLVRQRVGVNIAVVTRQKPRHDLLRRQLAARQREGAAVRHVATPHHHHHDHQH